MYSPCETKSILFIYFTLCPVYLTDDESDGVEMERSSSELSNLNEDWDSGMRRIANFKLNIKLITEICKRKRNSALWCELF